MNNLLPLKLVVYLKGVPKRATARTRETMEAALLLTELILYNIVNQGYLVGPLDCYFSPSKSAHP